MSSDHHEYWNRFYASTRSRSIPDQPSAFAHWTRERIAGGSKLWEFGFGTARDTIWFATHSHVVRGFDFAESAVQRARVLANQHHVQAAEFEVFDLYDDDKVQKLIATQRETGVSLTIYARFLLHSLRDEGRHNLFNIAAGIAGHRSVFLEFRTGEDAGRTHVFGEDHYRQYLDPQIVEKEIEERGGSVIERVEGYGMAIYKTEDPHVARLIAQW